MPRQILYLSHMSHMSTALRQLSATVMSGLALKHGYGRSLFERLLGLGTRLNLLDVQYRMHPEISSFPRTEFYKGKVGGSYCRTFKWLVETYLRMSGRPLLFSS